MIASPPQIGPYNIFVVFYLYEGNSVYQRLVGVSGLYLISDSNPQTPAWLTCRPTRVRVAIKAEVP